MSKDINNPPIQREVPVYDTATGEVYTVIATIPSDPSYGSHSQQPNNTPYIINNYPQVGGSFNQSKKYKWPKTVGVFLALFAIGGYFGAWMDRPFSGPPSLTSYVKDVLPQMPKRALEMARILPEDNGVVSNKENKGEANG